MFLPGVAMGWHLQVVELWHHYRPFGPLGFLDHCLALHRVLSRRETFGRPKILRRRAIAACCAFIFLSVTKEVRKQTSRKTRPLTYICSLNAANFSLIYNLPIYFQSIAGDNPLISGVKVIPTILSTSLSTVVSSSLVGRVNNYQVFLFAGAVLVTNRKWLDLHFRPRDSPGPSYRLPDPVRRWHRSFGADPSHCRRGNEHRVGLGRHFVHSSLQATPVTHRHTLQAG